MPQKLEDLFSAEEIESMSDEERQEFEKELEHETSNDDPEEGGTGDEAKGEAAEKTEEEKGADKAGDEAKSSDEPESDEPEPDAGDPGKPPPDDKEVETDDISKDEPAEQGKQTPEKQSEQEAEKERDKAVQDEIAEKKEKLQEDLNKLRVEFEEGQLTFEEYLDRRDEVKDQIREINVELKVQEAMIREKEQGAREQSESQWKADQEAFFSDNKDIVEDAKVFKVFAQQANIKLNTPEGQAMSNQELLETAAKEARAIMGLEQKKVSDNASEARRKANQAAGKKTAANLSDAPNASEQDVEGSAFSRLDRLLKKGGDELESAVEKMTPEQQDEWARNNN